MSMWSSISPRPWWYKVFERGDGVLDRYQDPTHQVGVAGAFHIAANGHHRDLIRGGVEVARDDDLGVRVGVEDLWGPKVIIDQTSEIELV
jgi:hypothetical protein